VIFKTQEDALKLARTATRLGLPNAEQRVAEVAFQQQCGIWHAAHIVVRDAYTSGELPTAICPHCGGRADVRIGWHWDCQVRADMGIPPRGRLDVVDGMQCPCNASGCKAARGGATTRL
jgi:hypothetical protein